MHATSMAVVLWLACAGCAYAGDPASAPSTASAAAASAPASAQAQTHGASLDNTHCDAYRASTMAVRSPKDMGTVVLRMEVSAQGEVLSSEVAERTTSNFFANVVRQNFAACHFRPALENGVPVPGHAVRLRLVFNDGTRSPNNAACPPPTSPVTPPSDGAMVATKLRVRFLPTGGVAGVDVLQSSGVPALDEAALTAFRQCHFDPSASGQPAFQEEWVTTLNWTG